jgi:hypothetical protein
MREVVIILPAAGSIKLPFTMKLISIPGSNGMLHVNFGRVKAFPLRQWIWPNRLLKNSKSL